jgi:hypothetical protein
VGVQHFLYIPVDPAKRDEMAAWWGLDLSRAVGKVPDVDRLRRDIDAMYIGYEGESWQTPEGFDAKYTKCLWEYEVDGRNVGEYDDLEFSYDRKDFATANLISLGRHLPRAGHSLRPFLDLVERHFGAFYIFTDGEMRPLTREELMATYL